MEFTILDINGKVIGTASCDSSEIETYMSINNGYEYIVGGGGLEDRYFDGLVMQVIPTRPSPNHVFNYVTKQWEDPRTLLDLKESQWHSIKQARALAEYAGFTWNGSVFDSDAISQNRITGAVTLAQLSPSFTIDWTLADNTVRTLNQVEMFQVGAALGTHVQTQFAKGQLLRVQIEAATTKEAIEAITWS